MQITGKVTRREPRKGTFTDPADGRKVDYDFDLLTVQTEFDTVEVKVTDARRESISNVGRGSIVTLEVDVPKGTRFPLIEVVKAPEQRAVRPA